MPTYVSTNPMRNQYRAPQYSSWLQVGDMRIVSDQIEPGLDATISRVVSTCRVYYTSPHLRLSFTSWLQGGVVIDTQSTHGAHPMTGWYILNSMHTMHVTL